MMTIVTVGNTATRPSRAARRPRTVSDGLPDRARSHAHRIGEPPADTVTRPLGRPVLEGGPAVQGHRRSRSAPMPPIAVISAPEGAPPVQPAVQGPQPGGAGPGGRRSGRWSSRGGSTTAVRGGAPTPVEGVEPFPPAQGRHSAPHLLAPAAHLGTLLRSGALRSNCAPGHSVSTGCPPATAGRSGVGTGRPHRAPAPAVRPSPLGERVTSLPPPPESAQPSDVSFPTLARPRQRYPGLPHRWACPLPPGPVAEPGVDHHRSISSARPPHRVSPPVPLPRTHESPYSSHVHAR